MVEGFSNVSGPQKLPPKGAPEQDQNIPLNDPKFQEALRYWTVYNLALQIMKHMRKAEQKQKADQSS